MILSSNSLFPVNFGLEFGLPEAYACIYLPPQAATHPYPTHILLPLFLNNMSQHPVGKE